MDSTSIRYRNTRLLVEKEGGVSAFAERLNKAQSQVSQFAGENPIKGIGPKIARQIEAAFNKPSGWLDVPHGHLTKDGSHKSERIPLALDGMAPWDSETPLGPDEVAIPYYKEVEMAAGSGMQHHLEINGRLLRFSLETLRRQGVDPSNAACATLRGTSHTPMIADGSTIGIDRGRTTVKDGALFALDHEGMLRVKFLYKLPGGGLRLRSTNVAEHPDEHYTADEAARNIRILGWVFWWSTLNSW